MASLLAAAGIGADGDDPIAASAEPQEAQPDKGAEAFTAVCSKCHLADRICRDAPHQIAVGRSPRQDDEARGADHRGQLRHANRLPAPELRQDRLNRGESKDIALVASLSPKDADALRKTRSEHGDFADFDALTKVPGST